MIQIKHGNRIGKMVAHGLANVLVQDLHGMTAIIDSRQRIVGGLKAQFILNCFQASYDFPHQFCL